MEHRHEWQLIAAGNKVWVACQQCSARFPFSSEYNGAPYLGKVPVKFGG